MLKLERITISLPHDSPTWEADHAQMIEEEYAGDFQLAEADEYREALDTLAGIARIIGLTFVRDTPHGAEWEGGLGQIATIRQNLPKWAHIRRVGIEFVEDFIDMD